MSRLFWKIFLALWLSIMAFAIVMALINASLVLHEPASARQEMLERTIFQVEQKLRQVLEQGDETQAIRLLKPLPRQVRNHVLVIRQDGERSSIELMGRERALEHFKRRQIPFNRTRVDSTTGARYDVIVASRIPPRALLEPGFRGVLYRLLMAGFVSALLSWWLARYLSRPLVQLGHVSRKLAAGDLAARVGQPLEGRADEFGQLARDLDEMASRLQELQAANQRLLRDVSHELRSPLARMRVALELARGRNSQAVADELDRIELESERLEALIDEVLGLMRESSEISPLRWEEFDLSDLLTDLKEVVNYEVPKGGRAVSLEAESPLQVIADRELIWRAVENLLRNALQHTDMDRGVELTAHRQSDAMVRVCVSDRGPGIPAQQLDRIFEPFYRVQEARDRKTGGHGLGLAIAAAAVRRHRGQISAANRPGGGLRFCIELPVKPL